MPSLASFSPPTLTMTNPSSDKSIGKHGGPKTVDGKERSRLNARTHSILATVMTKYEEKELQNYLEQFYDFYDPQTHLEEFLVERIAVCCLRLHRAGKAEAEFMRLKLEPRMVRPMIALMELDEVVQEGYKPTLMPEDVEQLQSKYLRYETAIENRMYKAMHALERLQRMRRGEDVMAPAVLDVHQDTSAEFVSQKDT
jgi:hypothetical protein